MKKKIFLVFGVALIFGLATYLYVFYKPHKNFESVSPDYKLTSQVFFEKYVSLGEIKGNEEFLNKVVQISGILKEVINNNSTTIIIISDSNSVSTIKCKLSDASKTEISNYGIGMSISLKGQCNGISLFEDMPDFSEVSLSRCFIIKL